MTVGRIEAEMDITELNEWAAFFKIEREKQEEEAMHAKAREGLERAKARPR